MKTFLPKKSLVFIHYAISLEMTICIPAQNSAATFMKLCSFTPSIPGKNFSEKKIKRKKTSNGAGPDL